MSNPIEAKKANNKVNLELRSPEKIKAMWFPEKANQADPSVKTSEKESGDDKVDAVVNELSEKDKRLVWLKYYEELTEEEIAKDSKCAVGTVKARLHQLRRRFKSRLSADKWK